MRGSLRIVLAVLAASFLVAMPVAATAAPDTSGNHITRWDATWVLREDGSADVTVEFDFDFGDDPGHGPYLTFPILMDYGDGEHDREYAMDAISVSSPSGAPANLYTEEEDGVLTLRIGDEDVDDVSGVQTYVLEYTVEGVMDATVAELDGADVDTDEFYFNVIGLYWEIPFADVSIEIDAPTDALDALCWAGSADSEDDCDDIEVDGTAVTVGQDVLDTYEGVTVAIAYPSGTFDTTPVLVEHRTLAKAFGLSWVTGAACLVVLVGGLWLIVRRLRRTAFDLEYDETIPGLAPSLGEDAPVRRRDRGAPVAVQFEPPAGLRPGQLGTLIDEKADPRDVTATIVDLAVRGYLSIEQSGTLEADGSLGSDGDFVLRKERKADDALLKYERKLFKALFKGRKEVALEELKTTFSEDMTEVQEALYDDVTRMGWFRDNPDDVRTAWGVLGSVLLLAGAGLAIVLAIWGSFAVLPVPFAILGLVMLATVRMTPARTPEGSRVLAQARGFELYLRTAEANQIRFEEGRDIFSRYLPFAIAFGHAERWARVFEELAARGTTLAEPDWYHGYAYGTFWAHSAGLGSRLESFESLASEALTAATPGSSGDSGFGGGSVGGGGGGGGGGGW
ncbi:DUF2207 domain-containing protein [Demequina salsinemoris]|uniref:DUF2207 domain-containing protein n=1 Tax=Demequina salsinemoris TaxID=577470 RepID=UPI000782F7F2|nr:DUF2207 domain-containing protein [Demequina salsinemoris]